MSRPEWFSVSRAAAYLGLDPNEFMEKVRKGALGYIPHFRTQMRFNKHTLDKRRHKFKGAA